MPNASPSPSQEVLARLLESLIFLRPTLLPIQSMKGETHAFVLLV
jgi:hypothetical protein